MKGQMPTSLQWDLPRGKTRRMEKIFKRDIDIAKNYLMEQLLKGEDL